MVKALPVLLAALLSAGTAPPWAQSTAPQSASGQPTPAQATVVSPTDSQSAQSKIPDWQIAAGGKMEFDVASVKQDTATPSAQTIHSNIPLGPQDLFSPTGGLLSSTNFPLMQYMVFAYKLAPDQVRSLAPNLPKWASTDRFDIQARAQGNPTKDQFRLMMQALLADRFKLAVHYETKQLPVFGLVLEKPGKLGPHLREHPKDSPCSSAANLPANPAQLPTVEGGFPEPCGAITVWPVTGSPGLLRAGGRNMPIETIASSMSLTQLTGIDRPVLNKTGLIGEFDFVMEFAPQFNGPLPPGANFQPDPAGTTFLQALKEQLGLKLESQTGPVEVFVVDHLEPPSEN